MAMMRITDTGGGSSKKTSSKTTTGNTRSGYSSGGGTSSNKSSSSNSSLLSKIQSYGGSVSKSTGSNKSSSNSSVTNPLSNSYQPTTTTKVTATRSPYSSNAGTGATKSNTTTRSDYSSNIGAGINTDWANQMKAKYYGSTSGNEVDVDDTPTYYSGSGSSGSSVDTSSYYDDLMAAFMEMNSANREAALNAILQNLDAVKGTYKQQIQDVNDEYDKLVNENEVKKDRARRVIRENQANRGQLDSGMGRQEMLDMNIGYDNITTNLKAAREKAVNEIYNLITQAEAEANTNKANVNNTYQNALLEWKLANQ